ncbi:MAG: hypothetical protein ACRDK7_01455 [Solirubrobacteraceae bacterium]
MSAAAQGIALTRLFGNWPPMPRTRATASSTLGVYGALPPTIVGVPPYATSVDTVRAQP